MKYDKQNLKMVGNNSYMNIEFRKQVPSTNNKRGDLIKMLNLNEKHIINRLRNLLIIF